MPLWSSHLNGGAEAKTFTVQGDSNAHSNAVVCQVRHCQEKTLWGNFTEEVVFGRMTRSEFQAH